MSHSVDIHVAGVTPTMLQVQTTSSVTQAHEHLLGQADFILGMIRRIPGTVWRQG